MGADAGIDCLTRTDRTSRERRPGLTYLIAAFAGIFLLWAAGLTAYFYHLRAEAKIVYENDLAHGDVPDGISFETWRGVYLRTSGFRAGIYAWLASVTAFVCLPFIVFLLTLIWNALWYAGGRPGVFAEGELVHSFYTAVGTMIGLVSVAFVYTWRYYSKAPEAFEDELKRELLKP